MSNYPQQSPPAKKGMSTLAIVFIVFGVITLLGIATCGAGVLWAGHAVSKIAAGITDGGTLVLQSPPNVVGDLAGSKKDYVGAWASTAGSTLIIDSTGNLKFSKHESGSASENISAPISGFRGDDLEMKVIITMHVVVTVAPHKVGDHWEMTADGIALQRK